MKTLIIAIAVSALALFAAVGFAQDFSGHHQGWGHMGWNGGQGWRHADTNNEIGNRYGHRGRGYRGHYAGDYRPCDYGWNQDQQRLPQRPAPEDETR